MLVKPNSWQKSSKVFDSTPNSLARVKTRIFVVFSLASLVPLVSFSFVGGLDKRISFGIENRTTPFPYCTSSLCPGGHGCVASHMTAW